MNTLGKRLKASRKARGITQKELEAKSGVSQQLISKIENEKIDATTEIFAFSDALEVSAKWLSTGIGKMEERRTGTALVGGLTDEAVEFAAMFQTLPKDKRAVLNQTAKAFIDTTKKQKGKVA